MKRSLLPNGQRLDSALISKENAPDLLDLSDLDVIKYVEAGALEDLYSYMEQGGRIHLMPVFFA